jgi:hypothetical protein
MVDRMARDYKRQVTRSGSGVLLSVCIGFILGLATARRDRNLLLNTPVPFLDRPKPADRQPAVRKSERRPKPPAAQDGSHALTSIVSSGPGRPVTGEQLKQAAALEKAGEAGARLGVFRPGRCLPSLRTRMA